MVVTASANLRPSEPYAVVFADGRLVSLRVVAVVTDDSLPGDLLVPRAVVRTHDPSALTSTVFVRDRIDPPVGARVVDVATWAAEADAAEDRLVWLFTLLLIGVSAGYGAIAVANTLLLAAAGRAADLRLIRLAGATRRQVIWLVTAESALVVLIGALLGGAVAFVGLLSIRRRPRRAGRRARSTWWCRGRWSPGWWGCACCSPWWRAAADVAAAAAPPRRSPVGIVG